MKKLQNNFTTPEQSNRLLELGVPADSADCFYSHYIKTYAHSEYTEILWHRPRFITEDNIPNWNARLMDGTQTYLPCWSIGRLIEVMTICYEWDLLSCASFRIYVTDIIGCNLINQLINDLSLEISRCKMDFSKLEE